MPRTPQTRYSPPQRQIQLKLPMAATLGGGRRDRGSIWVLPPGKPPRRRYDPGSFIRYEGQLYEIIYAYRVADNPNEWLYCCEERESIAPVEPAGAGAALCEALGAGETTPRVVREIFRDSMQAHEYFGDIYRHADQKVFPNKQLVRGATLVSSGELLD